MSEPAPKTVVCFGELLWDAMPRGLFPGGAPMNVAYHLKQLGAVPLPFTAVGNDPLGVELLRRLRAWGVDLSGVGVRADKATGLARVNFVNGSPEFEIVEDAAWDWIELSPAGLRRAVQADALLFGSLAQRTENNRRQLATLLAGCPAAWKVFDVNLRPPYDAAEPVWALAKQVDFVKLNDHELGRLLDEPVSANDLPAAVRRFAKRAGVVRVCLTAGAAGAGLLLDGDWLWEAARPVVVRDTVGAGDAFLAGLLAGWLRAEHPPAEILRRACRLAEFVATQDGATPAYSVDATGQVTAAAASA